MVETLDLLVSLAAEMVVPMLRAAAYQLTIFPAMRKQASVTPRSSWARQVAQLRMRWREAMAARFVMSI
jgi:hypothetical protein